MRKLGILIVLTAVVGMMFGNTAFASADGITIDPNNPEATTIALEDVAKVDISKVKVNAEYVGQWVMVDKSSINWKSCFWTKRGQRWTNSATGVGFYPEWTRAKLCPSSESSTGWVKVAGGRTGSPCRNPAIPPFKRQPRLKKKTVLDVRNLNNFGFKVHAHAGASIDAQGTVACPSGSFSVHLHSVAGTKSGGWFRVKIASRILKRNHGKVNGRVKVAIRNALRAQLSAEAAAEAAGQLTYKCGQGSPPPPPPPPPCTHCGPPPCTTCGCQGNCPPPPVNQPPIGEVVASAAHMQISDRRVELWFQATDPEGDAIALDIIASLPPGTYISGKRQTSTGWDGRACPAGYTCWSATMWSGNTTGDAIIQGKFTAKGGEFTSAPVVVKVEPDQFPQN